MNAGPRPLDGVRVLDMTRWIAGPHAGLMLGDMGADVVKLESCTGDPSRLSGPHINGESTYFMALNRSKRGVALNMRNQAGKEVLRNLIAQADILLENFRPGTLSKMGLGPAELRKLNNRLITVSVSGYGQDGPRAQQGVFDSVAQAASGLQSLTGRQDSPPVKAGFYIADYAAALHATIGALLAVVARDRSGVGQHVDISLVESLLSMSATLIPGYLGAGVVPVRQGNRNIHAAPADVVATSDGYVQISASTTKLFVALAHAMDREDLIDDPRFRTNADRVTNSVELSTAISGWAATLTSDEMERRLLDHGVPTSRVATIEDVVANDQLQYRNFFTTIEHPVAGPVTFAAPVVRLSDMPGYPTRSAPQLGQHTDEVLREWLDISAEDLAGLRARGAFGAAPVPA